MTLSITSLNKGIYNLTGVLVLSMFRSVSSLFMAHIIYWVRIISAFVVRTRDSLGTRVLP